MRIGDAISRKISVTSCALKKCHPGPLCCIWFVNRMLVNLYFVRVLFHGDDMKNIDCICSSLSEDFKTV
jgi:hypothetical protein